MSRDNRNWGLGPDARGRLGANLAVRRLRARASREELGLHAAVTTRRIAQIEDGRVGATLDVWVRLGGALDVSLDDLLAGVRWVPLEKGPDPDAGTYVVGRADR